MIIDSVNPTSSAAVYVQIENLVQFAIASGELKSGDQLPPAAKLADKLGVNINTVGKAYRDLEVMGLLFTRRGMGVYVAENARKTCRDRCYPAIASRLHEVTQEAKAAGMSKALIREAVTKSMAAASSPYGDTPAAVMALAKKK